MLRPMVLLFVSGAVTPGARVSNWRKLRVGSGSASRLRESMVDASRTVGAYQRRRIAYREFNTALGNL